MTSRGRRAVCSLRREREGGMVTVETAATLPVVVLVLAMVLMAVRLGADEVRCLDAARAGARAAARGDGDDAVTSLAVRAAPPRSTVAISRQGEDVSVAVAAPPPVDLPLVGALPPITARAVAALESSTQAVPTVAGGGTR